ncbi:MAG: HflC protein [Magnetococcales bacterium]|nr:HflC protein [Magnetococcales bacterium]|tara:strand:+ start:4894 stop:5757 length:864 start_codon:yes stop_codon:yes gene_type:complete
MSVKQTLFFIVFGIGAIVGANSLFTVHETEQAIVIQLGEVRKVISEPGLNYKLPFVQNVIFLDKRIMETDSKPEEIQSSLKEPMVVDSFTRWRIVDARQFYKAVRTESDARKRLDIIVNSNLRQKLALYTSKEIVSGDRDRIMQDILVSSRQQALPLGVEIVDVRIKRADWPAKISQAVYQRMNAERNKEAKEIRAQGAEKAQEIKATAEKERTIILANAQRDAQKLRGEGDAESIRITAEAFSKDAEFYSFIRSLEAYRSSLKGEDTFMVLDPSVDYFRHFNKLEK